MSGESSNSGGESPSYQRKTTTYQRSSGESPNEASESPVVQSRRTTPIQTSAKQKAPRPTREQRAEAYLKATSKANKNNTTPSNDDFGL